MTRERQPGQSQWETSGPTLNEFVQQFEKARNLFKECFTAANRHLAGTELSEGDLLCLGIGTGQVEEMAGLDSRRITGVDANHNLLRRAGNRLPHATLIRGLFKNVLPQLTHFHTTFSCDALDCLDPTELLETLKLVRERTGKVVVVQTFRPDDEFYNATSFNPKTGSRGGPGIEGWTDEQKELVERSLNSLGVTEQPPQTEALFRELQQMVEKSLGGSLDLNLNELIERLGFAYQKEPSSPEYRSLPYPAKITAFLEYLVGQAEIFKDAGVATSVISGKGFSLYIARHAFHSFTRLLINTMQLHHYFAVLEDACKKAGFTEIEKKTICARNGQICTDQDAVDDLNGALQTTHPAAITKRNTAKGLNSSWFVNASPLQFIEPAEKPFNTIRLQYLVAK